MTDEIVLNAFIMKRGRDDSTFALYYISRIEAMTRTPQRFGTGFSIDSWRSTNNNDADKLMRPIWIGAGGNFFDDMDIIMDVMRRAAYKMHINPLNVVSVSVRYESDYVLQWSRGWTSVISDLEEYFSTL